jgi:hypothetical protein
LLSLYSLKARPHSHHDSHTHSHKYSHEQKTRIVVYLTTAAMIAEIAFGYCTNSMALLSVIITRWAIGLAINSGKDLLDYRAL